MNTKNKIFNDITPLFDQDYPPDKHYEIDLSLSENPLGFSPRLHDFLCSEKAKEIIGHYPDRNTAFLKKALSDFLNISDKNLYISDGASGTIQAIVKIFISSGKHILMPDTTFPAPAFGAVSLGGSARIVPLQENFHINFEYFLNACDKNTGLIFICNPNNPTGIIETKENIYKLANSVSVPVVVSEANIEFCEEPSILDIDNMPDNLIIVRSFSKAYGLAGLRIGYAVCSANWIEKLEKYNHIFKISSLSELLAAEALKDQDHVKKSISFVREQRDFLMSELGKLCFKIIPSQSNTFVARLPAYINSQKFHNGLKENNCAVVPCDSFLSLGESFIRVSPRSVDINKKFVQVVKDILKKYK